MDSDDDFMSDVSSQDDFLDTQDSDNDSLGEGESKLSFQMFYGVALTNDLLFQILVISTADSPMTKTCLPKSENPTKSSSRCSTLQISSENS
jgi:hypothetical protein